MLFRILVFLILSCCGFSLSATNRYAVQIDFQKAYISGVCIMHQEDDIVSASIMNEFGVSALAYRYDRKSGKVKILNIIKQLDKWYIRRVLKKDLRAIMKLMPTDDNLKYSNQKYHIIYNFTPLNDETA